MLLFLAGMAVGSVLTTVFLVHRINRDEVFITDLIDRLHCKDADQYLYFLHQREQYEKKVEPWYARVFRRVRKPIQKAAVQKNDLRTKEAIELEKQKVSQALRAKIEDTAEEAHRQDFERQLKERSESGRDSVVP